MSLHGLLVYRIPCTPIYTLIESMRCSGYYVYVWDIVIDSLGVSGDSTYGKLMARDFSLAGARFCFAVGVYWELPTGHLCRVQVCRWTRVVT